MGPIRVGTHALSYRRRLEHDASHHHQHALGHQDVAEAGNGKEGLDRLSAGAVDVIITDWNMPEMSGIDFIRAVRAMPSIKHTPVLMVTTNAAKDDIVEALKAAVNDYVVKPFTPDTMKKRSKRFSPPALKLRRASHGESDATRGCPGTAHRDLTAATRHVFETMVFREVEAAPPMTAEPLRRGANVVGIVAFAGKISGLVVFYSSLETARVITASMLGIDASNVQEELPDAIGELTNMIAGSFRTRIAHATGEAWAISVPTVTIGSDFLHDLRQRRASV